MVKGVKFSSFVTDEHLEEDGVWIDYSSGFRVKIARFGNKKFQAYMRGKSRHELREISTGNIESEAAETMIRDGIAQFVLLGWENLLDDNGKPIQYSVERARELLKTKDFLREIVELSQQRELFQQAKKEMAEKNL
jgi:hypothetical protein